MANKQSFVFEGETSGCDIKVVFPNQKHNLCTINLPPSTQRWQRHTQPLLVHQEKKRLLDEVGIKEPPADQLEMVLRLVQGKEIVMDDDREIGYYRVSLCQGGSEIEIRYRSHSTREANPSHPADMGYNLKGDVQDQ